MTISKTFWVWLALFEIAFGFAVFYVTRSVYMEKDVPVVRSSPPVSTASDSQHDALRDAVSNPYFQSDSTLFVEMNDPVEISRLADSFFAAQDYAKAANMYERLLKFNPQSVDIHNNLGLSLHYIGRSDEALNWLEKGIEIDPDSQRIWLTLGFVASGTGDMTRASNALNNAMTKGSDESIRESASRMLDALP